MGRKIQVSGPPLTWEYKNHTRSDDSSSGSSASTGSSQTLLASPVKDKGTLPPLPSSPTKRHDQDSTVRNAHSNGVEEDQDTPRGGRREPSDDYSDEYDLYQGVYTARAGHSPPTYLHHQEAHSHQDLLDTGMLDSVVLPAIASVRYCLWF